MAATDLVPVDQQSTFDLLPKAHDLATAIAKTEFVPQALRNRPEAVMACVLAGHEMGIGPMAALSKIHVIQGRPAPAAELMRAVVLAHGHEIWIEESNTTRVTVCGRRAGSDHTTKVTWTMDDANRAKLTNKDGWRAYPRAMLLARATGELCRAIFPDVLAGLSYSAEEVEDGFDLEPEPAAPADDQVATTTRQVPARTRGAKKAAAKKAAAPKVEAPAADELPPLPGDDDIVDAEIVEDDAPTPAAPPPAPPGDDDAVKKRRQQIAMRAQELDLDRADVIYAVTGGRKTSAAALDLAEADAVLEALRRLKTGELRLAERDDLPVLVDAEPVPNEPDEPEPEPIAAEAPDLDLPHTWDAARWRTEIKERGRKVTETIVAAQRLAREIGEDEPGSLDALAGRESLAALVLAELEEPGS